MNVRISVSQHLLEELESIALRAYPREAIGTLYGYLRRNPSGWHVRVFQVSNVYITVHSTSQMMVKFTLDPSAMSNPAWAGIWHSHPEGACEPSSRDLETAARMSALAGIPLVEAVTSVKKHSRMRHAICCHSFTLVNGPRILGSLRIGGGGCSRHGR